MKVVSSCTAAISSSISSTFRFPSITLNFQRGISMSQLPIHSASAASLSSSAVDSTNDSSKQHPWLLVGLGNPGKMYQRTRHNVGFEMVDAIAEAEGISMTSVSFKALFGKGLIGNVPVILAKPQTFMNASGESVGAIVSYYKIPLKQVLVIYDDLDLPFAKLRLLPKGGHGGHNGMRSVIDRLKGSRDFPRLRIGIGRPPGKMDSANFVLRPFNKHEREELDFTFDRGVEAIRILLVDGFNKSATFVNTPKSMEQLS
ncbi:Peptidyl-tRNA hydrolase family protein [Euphorbia peplus]|nr:Peptidyl-tRNA hydrolase family protein [Euphorbia peplus]